MNLQIGTVDGLVNITPKAIYCFVNAINAFSKGGVEYAREANVSFGIAFQRFVEPVYTGIKENFDLKDIYKPVYTTNNKEQSPARVTFCKKMGLLKIDDSNDVFELTPLAEEIRLKKITIEEYAFILLTKQGVFIDGKYVCNLFSLIAQRFEESATISDIEILDYIKEKFEDADIEKTRADIIVNALCTTGLIAKISKGVYVLSNTLYAEIFKDFKEKSYLLSPSYIDKDDSYIEYMGDMKYGVFDIIDNKNKDIYFRKYPNLSKYINLNIDSMNKDNILQKPIKGPLQQIFYGAPGTGKSDTIFERTKDLPKEDVYRTTFHPDSDYASFVGSYKPKMNDRTVYGAQGPLRNSRGEEISEPKITYTFSPQAFTNAYIRAWQTDEPVFLIIEEINRGNCAQIFGDLFQLLDRDENGYSKYDIVPDSDLSDYIKGKLEDAAEKEGLTSHIKEGKILKLPNNLYIWATMNTSDQSLFPIDSAFKRRWEWKYIKIKKGIDKKTGAELDWKIKVGEDNSYDWWEFLKAINYKIDKMTSSADKQLGYFFCLADGKGEISADTFVNKVAFYLWNDVFKDYAEDGSPLLKYKKNEEDKSESDLTFPDFFDQSGEIDKNVVKQFIEKVMKEDDMDKPAE